MGVVDYEDVLKRSEGRVCPLMDGRSCLREKCQWWIPEYNSCALPRLPPALTRLSTALLEAVR